MENKIKNSWKKGFYKDIEKQPEKIFRDVNKELPEFIKLLKKIKAKNVLDLGCGTGKHLVVLAKCGFRVLGFDLIDKVIKIAEDWLKKEGLKADLSVGDIYKKLPYEDNFFDGVISTKALHHGTVDQIKKLVKELERIMKPGGILMVEVPRKKKGYERFKGEHKEIETGTLVPISGSEKDVPHHIFSSRKELVDLFSNYKVLGIVLSGNANRRNHYTLFGKLK
ncbi:MAG: class I SAM-dependent methyltransferase [Patescibacteria group bacterium]